ncbi:anaerobic glycerol-3-phosphate dehydrogenase subunit GlpA [Propionibacterium sp.]|uniref:anaerobic glycerol-3-phosphate dehydrogenase subunit GlpA n=1 Tax=Propionibacterium sp. TaxID=1977903 RepID=UPI0039E931F3
MADLSVDVVVVGGGATGVGVARDAAMRGLDVVLVERADLAQGTTGRYHGLLHSGGRYVVSDPESARQCAEENSIITRIHADAVEQTGGLFVVTPDDSEEYADGFLAAAQAAHVPAEEIRVGQALEREPRLNRGIKRAFAVFDGTVDGWQMVWGAAESAKEHGATILSYHRLTEILRADGKVVGVRCHDEKHDRELGIDCRFVINAAGAWAGQVAAMAGCEDVEVVPGRGIMIAMNHRLVNTVINRCIYPADGDILVPVHTVSVIGTTDVKAVDPDRLPIPHDEVQQMFDAGEALIPGFRQARAVHAWSGARPLVKDTRVSAGDTRHMSRGMAVIDHQERDDLSGLLSVSGGKLTTYRWMAEHIVDQMCEQMGEQRACTTASEPVPAAVGTPTYRVTHRLAEREHEWQKDQIICECELMSRSMIVDLLKEDPLATLDDLRRRLRLGMGPCQGGFCSTRAAGLMVSEGAADSIEATHALREFLKHRWIGLWPILGGLQVRQAALDEWIARGTLDIDHAPGAADPPEQFPVGPEQSGDSQQTVGAQQTGQVA